MKAVEDYRRLAGQSAHELRLVDGEISTTLAGDTTDLFGQTRNAQNAFEHGLKVSQAIDQHESPPALAGLRDELTQVSLAYLETASFQARPFYEGLGYTVFGELAGVAEGCTLFFLRKLLSALGSHQDGPETSAA